MLYFKKTPIKTIIMATSWFAIIAIMAIFTIMAIMAHHDICHNYGLDGCLFKISKKCRSLAKSMLKNVHVVKSYGQNKTNVDIMAISFVF